MPSRCSDARLLILLLSTGVLLMPAGCAKEKVHAAAPVTTLPAPAPVESKPATPAPPPPKIDAQPTPAAMPTEKAADTPPMPRPKTEKSADQTADSETSEASQPHPAAPQISPQLSAADQATYQQKTSEDVAAAENNLKQSSGKRLSAAQQDLADKIRSFLGQSREASQTGDWARAQNLAQKAHLLSVELVKSL